MKHANAPGDLGHVLSRVVATCPVWSPEEERAAGKRLLAARRSGNAAALRRIENDFVQHNVLLAVSIARRYANRGVDADDLLQEALSGLLHAVRKFDPKKGVRYPTYATWWCRQVCSRSTDEAHHIYLPLKVAETRRMLARKQAEFEADRGRPATEEELAAVARMPRKVVARALRAPAALTSLDARLGEGRDTVADATPSNAPSALDELTRQEQRRHVREALRRLPERARFVLDERFGDEEKTLREIGPPLGITRERVRQIEKAGLTALRNDSALAQSQRP